MINLLTGVPGSGKTSFSLDFMLQQTAGGRKLYVHGVPELKIPHIKLTCSSKLCTACIELSDEEKAKAFPADEWNIHCEDNAVIFMDEVQHVFRARGQKMTPEAVEAFETHRHRGLDFYLLTQSPKLIDSNIRELVSRHIHLKSNWLHRLQFEWPECKDNVRSTTDAIKSGYKLKKYTFDLYRSATQHTKQKHKIPMAFYILLFLIPTVITAGYFIYDGMLGKALAGEPASTSYEQGQAAARAGADKTYAEKSLDFKPAILGVLESAPAYARIRKVKTFPQIQGCITSPSKGCICYTQQGTRYPMQAQQCLNYVAGEAVAFNPYLEKPKKQRREYESQKPSFVPKSVESPKEPESESIQVPRPRSTFASVYTSHANYIGDIE